MMDLAIPIIAGEGISIDKADNEEKIEIKSTNSINILTQEQVDLLF